MNELYVDWTLVSHELDDSKEVRSGSSLRDDPATPASKQHNRKAPALKSNLEPSHYELSELHLPQFAKMTCCYAAKV